MVIKRRKPLKHCWGIWAFDASTLRHDLETVMATKRDALSWIDANAHHDEKPRRYFWYARRRTATDSDRAMITAYVVGGDSNCVAIGLRIRKPSFVEFTHGTPTQTRYI